MFIVKYKFGDIYWARKGLGWNSRRYAQVFASPQEALSHIVICTSGSYVKSNCEVVEISPNEEHRILLGDNRVDFYFLDVKLTNNKV